MAKTLTPKEIALDWGISPKTLRKFLRKDEKAIAAQGGETPGKGGRWAIPATSLKTMRKRFDAWMVTQREEADKRRAAREAEESTEAPDDADDAELDASEEEGDDEVESDETPDEA